MDAQIRLRVGCRQRVARISWSSSRHGRGFRFKLSKGIQSKRGSLMLCHVRVAVPSRRGRANMLADSVQSRYAEDADAAVVVTVCIASRAIAGRCSGRNPSSCTAAQTDMRFLSPFQPPRPVGTMLNDLHWHLRFERRTRILKTAFQLVPNGMRLKRVSPT